MIQFKEWHLTWDGAPVAMQFDSGSVPLEIRGELPEGYDWEVLMEAPEGGLNILTDPVFSDRASPLSAVGPKRVNPPGVQF